MVLIVKAFPKRGTMNGKAAAGWGGAMAVFFTIWIVGMMLA